MSKSRWEVVSLTGIDPRMGFIASAVLAVFDSEHEADKWIDDNFTLDECFQMEIDVYEVCSYER